MKSSDCTLFSGGVKGAEEEFGVQAEKAGVEEVTFTFEGHSTKRKRGLHFLTNEELKKGEFSLAYISKLMNRSYTHGPKLKKVLQSIWHQINSAEEVFVIGKILDDATVKGGTVKNGAKDVDPGPINESGKLEVTFSEAVVKGEASLGVDGGDALGTQAEWAADKVTLSLNAGVALANETTYVIIIKGVKDAAGNAMAEAKISFTTKGKE